MAIVMLVVLFAASKNKSDEGAHSFHSFDLIYFPGAFKAPGIQIPPKAVENIFEKHLYGLC